MKNEILNGKSALADGYCTWLDGVHYEGEVEASQFGSNPNIVNEWFGARMGLPAPVQYDFLSEGDSPTYFPLFQWGFRTLEDFSYGGIAGRYHKEAETNSRGEVLNMWNVSEDHYIGRDGKDYMVESMWPYVADIQRDFAARVDWAAADAFEKAEHAPELTIREGIDLTAAAGELITLTACAKSPDEKNVTISFKIYKEASASCAEEAVLSVSDEKATLTVPASAVSGDKIHIIVKAQADGHHKLVHYQQVIVTVK